MDDGSALASHPDPHKVVRSLASRYGFHDEHYRGELARVFDGIGRSIRYLRRNGLTLDEMGEKLYDERVTRYRPSPNEVLALLSETFESRPQASKPKRTVSERKRSAAIDKAKRNRQLKFACECGQIARASRNTLLDCGLCRELYGVTRRMLRVDPLPEELLNA